MKSVIITSETVLTAAAAAAGAGNAADESTTQTYYVTADGSISLMPNGLGAARPGSCRCAINMVDRVRRHHRVRALLGSSFSRL